MVTVFDCALLRSAPVAVMTSDTALPVGTPAGTCTFTCYSATRVGVNPANVTGTLTPPRALARHHQWV